MRANSLIQSASYPRSAILEAIHDLFEVTVSITKIWVARDESPCNNSVDGRLRYRKRFLKN